MTIRLSQLLASATIDGDVMMLDVPVSWAQGRSVFGGLQVALALQAMRRIVPDGILRTLQTTFIAPVSGLLRVRAQILRKGKNATHIEAHLFDDTAIQAIIIGVFGGARPSVVARSIAPRSFALDPAKVIEFPAGTQSDSAPHFSQNFGARWLRGQPPFTGDTSYEQVIELEFVDEGFATEAHLVAMADFIPPIGLSHLKAPAPGSTLTWMLELLVDRLDQVALKGWRVEAELIAARDGYTSQAVRLFGPGGEPLALSHQSMLVFG